VIDLETGPVTLNAGDLSVVPRGTRHNPVAADECWIVLVETVTTKHTGDVITERRLRHAGLIDASDGRATTWRAPVWSDGRDAQNTSTAVRLRPLAST